MRLLATLCITTVACALWIPAYWLGIVNLFNHEPALNLLQFRSENVATLIFCSILWLFITTGGLVALILFMIFEVSRVGTALTITVAGFLGAMSPLVFIVYWLQSYSTELLTVPIMAIIYYQLGHWVIAGAVSAKVGVKPL